MRSVLSCGQAIARGSEVESGDAPPPPERQLVGSRAWSIFESRRLVGSPTSRRTTSDSRLGMCERRGSWPVLRSHAHPGSIHTSLAFAKTGDWARTLVSSKTSSSTAEGSSEAVMMSSQR